MAFSKNSFPLQNRRASGQASCCGSRRNSFVPPDLLRFPRRKRESPSQGRGIRAALRGRGRNTAAPLATDKLRPRKRLPDAFPKKDEKSHATPPTPGRGAAACQCLPTLTSSVPMGSSAREKPLHPRGKRKETRSGAVARVHALFVSEGADATKNLKEKKWTKPRPQGSGRMQAELGISTTPQRRVCD